MKRGVVSVLTGIVLSLSSCYKPLQDLDFPYEYYNKRDGSPYYHYYDEKDNFAIFTMTHSERYVDKAKDKISELIKKVDERLKGLEGNREETETIPILILHGKDYHRLMKNRHPDCPHRWYNFGNYDLHNRFIVLKSFYRGFSETEQRVFVHEYIHWRDFQDGYEDFTEGNVIWLTNEILGKQPIFRPIRFGAFSM